MAANGETRESPVEYEDLALLEEEFDDIDNEARKYSAIDYP